MIDILIFCGANNLDELIATIESIVKSDTKYINMLVKLPDLKSQENIKKYISENYFKQKIEVLRGCDSGPENAINQLISYAKSEYIQILPAGDLVCANYYDEVYKKIINNPDVVFTSSILMNTKNTGVYQKPNNFIFHIHKGIINNHLSAIIFSKKIIGVNKFCETYKIASDIDFLVRVLYNKAVCIEIDDVHTIAAVPGNSSNELTAGLELIHIYGKNRKILIGLKIGILKIIKSIIRPIFLKIHKRVNFEN
jgi:hypothetical protein